MVVNKIQQLGKVNRPITFQSPEKYPDIKRPDKLKHTQARHVTVFAPNQENKELLHLPEQLSKLIYATENELKDLLEVTRTCYDSKSFSTLAANSDLVEGVGRTPQACSSLSDFVMYGGQRNPYMADLREMDHKKVDQEKQKNEEKAKQMKQENDAAVSVLHRAATKDSTIGIALRPSRPPPKLLVAPKVHIDGAFDIGEQEAGEDDVSLVNTGSKFKFGAYTDSMGDETDAPAKLEDQRVHGDALDFISEKKPTFLKHSQTMAAAKSQMVSTPSAMPSQSLQKSISTDPQPVERPMQKFTSEDIARPPPMMDAPNISAPIPPPSIDIPVPPPLSMDQPPAMDIPIPPPVMDIPLPPISMPSVAPPSAADIAKRVEAPAPSSDRRKRVLCDLCV